MRKPLIGMVVLLAMALGASTAKAQTELYLKSGASTTTISTGTSGTPSFVGPVFSLSFNGWSFFVLGTSNSPDLQGVGGPFGLDSLSLSAACSAGACSPLEVFVSDTGFTQTAPGFVTSYSLQTLTQATGGSGASTSETSYYGSGYFDTAHTIGTVSLSGAGFGYASKNGPFGGPYSLTIEDTFTSGTKATTFDLANVEIAATPEPRTMLLFGTGLLVFAGILRRRRRA